MKHLNALEQDQEPEYIRVRFFHNTGCWFWIRIQVYKLHKNLKNFFHICKNVFFDTFAYEKKNTIFNRSLR
jgi:hypothetical protein